MLRLTRKIRTRTNLKRQSVVYSAPDTGSTALLLGMSLLAAAVSQLARLVSRTRKSDLVRLVGLIVSLISRNFKKARHSSQRWVAFSNNLQPESVSAKCAGQTAGAEWRQAWGWRLEMALR
jgi:hypothetical protein